MIPAAKDSPAETVSFGCRSASCAAQIYVGVPSCTNIPDVLCRSITLRLRIAQKPYIVWSLGPKALEHEFLEPKG